MANLEVQLSGEDINQAIAEAIIKSVLGDAIVKGVNDYVKRMIQDSYGSPLKALIEETAKNLIVKLLLQHVPAIEAEIQKQLSSEMTNQIAMKAIEKFSKGIY